MEVRDNREMKMDSGVSVGVRVRVWGVSVRVWVRQTRERICVSKEKGGNGWGDKGARLRDGCGNGMRVRKRRVRMIMRKREGEGTGPKGGVTGVWVEGLIRRKLRRVDRGVESHIADARGG